MSLDKIGQLWLIYIKDNRKYSTYRKYANIYDMHIRDTFGSLTADEISLEIIEKALPKEMSASLYKSIYCVLNQILSYGNRYLSLIHISYEQDPGSRSGSGILLRCWCTDRFRISGR